MRHLLIVGGGVCIFFLVLLIPFSRVFAATDPIAHWKFDDGSGTAPVDSSGNGITGSFLSPNPTWSTDVPSAITFSDPYSLDFTGTHDGVTFSWPSGHNFSSTAPRSFSFWYKPVADGENDAGGYDRIISWTSDQFEIAGTTAGSANHTISYYDGNWNSTSLTLTLGTWYHITFTYDGTIAKFYIGNDLKDSHSLAGRSLSGTMAIGTRENGHNEGINGRIDDVRVYDYALSSTQIENLTSGSNNPDTPPTTSTPSPTVTPTPSPTVPGGASVSPIPSSVSLSGTSSCLALAPLSSPSLFQVHSVGTSVTIYFTPVNPVTGYNVQYGQNADANSYAVSFDAGRNDGVVSYPIHSLNRNTRYYFRVRGMNGCMPGPWSQTLKSTPVDIKITNVPVPTIRPTPATVSEQVLLSEQEQTEKKKVYDVSIIIRNRGIPVENAEIELHSTSRKTRTDSNGVARFTDVEKGEHTVFLAYNGYKGEQHIALDGDKTDVVINLSVQMRSDTSLFRIAWLLVVGLLLFLICLLLVFRLKRRFSKTSPSRK